LRFKLKGKSQEKSELADQLSLHEEHKTGAAQSESAAAQAV